MLTANFSSREKPPFLKFNFSKREVPDFEVDSTFIVLTALKALADEGFVSNELVLDVIDRYKINPDKINPIYS